MLWLTRLLAIRTPQNASRKAGARGHMSENHKMILVVTSHGIRTTAPWQRRLEQLVCSEAAKFDPNEGDVHVTFLHNEYLYFSLFAFMNPWRRRREVLTFEKRLRAILKETRYDAVHLVGHSFGTHIIAHSLLRIGGDLGRTIDTVILAGSVLHRSFPWDSLVSQHVKRLVNECGDRDVILVLNALLPLGSGLAGRRGFAGITGHHFRNRFFNFGHSGYFEPNLSEDRDEFMRRYWLPLLLSAAIDIRPVDERPNGFWANTRGWLVDQTQNMKWMVPSGFVVVLCLIMLYFAVVWRTNFNLETVRQAGVVVEAVKSFRLEDAGRLVAERETAIEKRSNSIITRLEILFRSDVVKSLRPPQWVAARLTAALTELPRSSLSVGQPFLLRYRGKRTLELQTLVNEEFGGELGNIALRHIDLETLALSQLPMWNWKGPFAGRQEPPKPGNYGPFPVSDNRPVVPIDFLFTRDRFMPLNDLALQGKLEGARAVALTDRELSLWDIDLEKKLGSWISKSWGDAILIDARPCGSERVVAVDESGSGYVFGNGVVTKLQFHATNPKLIYLQGNATCSAFIGISDTGRAVIWSTSGDTPKMFIDYNRVVRSFQFSPRDPSLALLNTTTTGASKGDEAVFFMRVGTTESPEVDIPAGLVDASFSPTGRYVVAAVTDRSSDDFECKLIEIVDRDKSMTLSDTPTQSLNCRSLASLHSARRLSDNIIFNRQDDFLLAMEDREGQAGGNLSMRKIGSDQPDWMVRAGRSDVTSVAASADGSVIVSTNGDQTGSGVGGDFSFRIWSPSAQSHWYERPRREPSQIVHGLVQMGRQPLSCGAGGTRNKLG